MKENNVIMYDEYLIKKHQMIKDDVNEIWNFTKLVIYAGAVVAFGILIVYCYISYG